ncbi:tRNA (adenosine(37)-N6)-dimethylallyltransferase MiaA [Alphaproteobacteria bacterium KMM 3653]|uniref:tRNA dimethylallyltransferase n=1 Tax=Harenicola maris TaxID=2841044 RepID=A0AAP2G7S4_9RHOB|nr:tRNA (adenosine(37)-N6)-dimethylallyltransferase MiaA [Harenicola maris]
MRIDEILEAMTPRCPVLIAGPTASGKSALALEVVRRGGGVIINADALQVFADWQILTARPGAEDLAQAEHLLYGHVPGSRAYSVGAWLRDIAPLLSGGARPVIVGGTGLYFSALTEGLAEIPPVPAEVSAEAEGLTLEEMVAALGEDVRGRIDLRNPMRVRRAWEVERATGRSIAAWQDETPPPLLPLDACLPICVEAPVDWLNPRIERRFDMMVEAGLWEEVRRNAPGWSPALPSAKAIGAGALIAEALGEAPEGSAAQEVVNGTRQYAKRQRTWFRKRMRDWNWVSLA